MVKMRPETAIYADLNMTEIESDIEATLAKLRWIEMEKEDELEEAEIMDRLEHSDKENMDNVEMEARLIWNESDNSIDMGRAKATDMKGNKRIKLPPALSEKKEHFLQTRASLWRETVKQYSDEYCSGNGKQKQTLDPELLVGINKLRKRAAKKADIITVSDKGNDFVIEDIDVYEKQMEEQTGKDDPIDRKEVIENERRLNTVLKNFNNVFGTGAAHGKVNRKRIWDNR